MKQTLLTLFFLSLTFPSQARSIGIPDYNWKLNDISSLGHNKEDLFTRMDRDLIRVGNSICSNRAHMWAFDFKENKSIDSAKIFLFFTKKTGTHGNVTWWYHVAPVVNEKSVAWVMDAGFPGGIKKPLTISEWLKHFTKTGNCKEMKASETDLIEHIFTARTYPQETSYGNFDCYYKLTPAGYWTPNTVALNILGRNSQGHPVNFERNEIKKGEVYTACLEATTTGFGRALGGGKLKCRKYLEENLPGLEPAGDVF